MRRAPTQSCARQSVHNDSLVLLHLGHAMLSLALLPLCLFLRPGMEVDCASSPAWLLGCCYRDQSPAKRTDPSSSKCQEHSHPPTHIEQCTEEQIPASHRGESVGHGLQGPQSSKSGGGAADFVEDWCARILITYRKGIALGAVLARDRHVASASRSCCCCCTSVLCAHSSRFLVLYGIDLCSFFWEWLVQISNRWGRHASRLTSAGAA